MRNTMELRSNRSESPVGEPNAWRSAASRGLMRCAGKVFAVRKATIDTRRNETPRDTKRTKTTTQAPVNSRYERSPDGEATSSGHRSPFPCTPRLHGVKGRRITPERKRMKKSRGSMPIAGHQETSLLQKEENTGSWRRCRG